MRNEEPAKVAPCFQPMINAAINTSFPVLPLPPGLQPSLSMFTSLHIEQPTIDRRTSQQARAAGEDAGPGSMPPPRTSETQNVLSFEGSADEVLRYTIVAKVRFWGFRYTW